MATFAALKIQGDLTEAPNVLWPHSGTLYICYFPSYSRSLIFIQVVPALDASILTMGKICLKNDK